MAAGPGEHRGRVGQAGGALQAVGPALETVGLARGEVVPPLVGGGEVAYQHDLGHLRGGMQPPVGAGELLARETQPVHAGVQLEPDPQRAGEAGRQERFELLRTVDHGVDPPRSQLFELFGGEEAGHEQDRLGEAGVAQRQRLLQAGDAEGVGARCQGAGDLHGAVTIAVGLDHRDDPGRRRQLPRQLVVPPDRRQVDPGADRPSHWPASPPSRAPGGAAS